MAMVQRIKDIKKELSDIFGDSHTSTFDLEYDHCNMLMNIYPNFVLFEMGVDQQIVDLLKKNPFIRLFLYMYGASLYVSNPTGREYMYSMVNDVPKIYSEVSGQCGWALRCGVDDIGEWKKVRIDGDVSVELIQEMSDVEFYLFMDQESRILGLGDIRFSCMERINRICLPGNVKLGYILREFYEKRDRNHFIDQLIEAGYEEWI